MINVVLLGSGNVARHLYTIFDSKKNSNVVQCYNRKGIKLSKNQIITSITSDINTLTLADVYIIAVSDDAVIEVTKKLPFSNRLVVHTSGSVPLSSMADRNRRGVFYPLQTFSADKEVDFLKVPICIETENQNDFLILESLANSISTMVYPISSEQRNMLHVAAVFVNNFTNHMFSLGNDICKEYGVPFEVLHPLIQETAKKIITIDPDQAQTGPAIRNDIQTIERHLSVLKKDSQKKIYKSLTKSIQKKNGKKL